MKEGIENQREGLEEKTNEYLVKTSYGLVINWEKLLKDERTYIESFSEVRDSLLTKVLGSELTARNAPRSWLISDGERILSPKNSDGEPYSFIKKDRAIIYAKAIGSTFNQVYGNSSLCI